jgi:hypothetical protein
MLFSQLQSGEPRVASEAVTSKVRDKQFSPSLSAKMAFTGGNERFHRGLPCLVSAAIRGASPHCSRVLFARVLPLRRELNHLVQLLPSTSVSCVVVSDNSAVFSCQEQTLR